MKPSVGRIVHYVAYGTPGGEFPAGVCRASIVTEVQEFPATGPQPPGGILTGLCVLNPTGQFFNRGLAQDEETKKPGTWHWPERVEE
jgi:hypothetical protein